MVIRYKSIDDTHVESDVRYMRLALAYARRNLGQTAPNPSVGCVIVNSDRIVGAASTSAGGRPHAETNALKMAGIAAKGATAYVTLEPCCHHGQTPPCGDALISAGISRVVVATRDPYSKVAGKGIKALEHAGISIVEGVCEAEARALNVGFFKLHESGLPWVTLKLATSIDGKVALSNGKSQWITGAAARQYGHLLRARHDVILTGIGTVNADDPALNCRLPGLEHASPIRVVCDTHLSIKMDAKLVKTAHEIPLWIMTTSDDKKSGAQLARMGVRVESVASGKDGYVDLVSVLKNLAKNGITRVLVEAGEALSTAFLESALIDEIVWFQSPSVIGADGKGAVSDLQLKTVAEMPRFLPMSVRQFGDDICRIFRCK